MGSLIAAVLFSATSNAATTTIDLSKSKIDQGAFNFSYSFSIANGFTGTIDGQLGSVFRTANGNSVNGVDLTDVSLESISLISLVENDAQVVTVNGRASTTTDTYTFSSGVLNAGSYTFKVLGNAFSAGAGANNFSGVLNVVTTPVPEPEAFSMIALGLGLVGLAGLRKKK
eukprot:Amastigsp_a531147_3.p1 type:complete len:171 gc:universal Amastigsp_a531147_3:518-6(-)